MSGEMELYASSSPLICLESGGLRRMVRRTFVVAESLEDIVLSVPAQLLNFCVHGVEELADDHSGTCLQ